MKLLRYGKPGLEKPGVMDEEGNIRDLSSCISDVAGDALSPESLDTLKSVDLNDLPRVDPSVRMGPCVGGVGKFICIGLNYADHAAESNMAVPDEPVIFMKSTTAIMGPNDNIVRPKNSTQLDWEVELGVVIGRRASYITESEAEEYIAGYCLINDISERGFQLERQGQWTKGKSCDTFGPIGPWLVTKDELADSNNLDMWLSVNDTQYQMGNTKTMVYKPAFIVSYLSQFMSLEPGDIISTGTPPGVGLGQKPPVYLLDGDRVCLGISGLGTQEQCVVPNCAESPRLLSEIYG